MSKSIARAPSFAAAVFKITLKRFFMMTRPSLISVIVAVVVKPMELILRKRIRNFAAYAFLPFAAMICVRGHALVGLWLKCLAQERLPAFSVPHDAVDAVFALFLILSMNLMSSRKIFKPNMICSSKNRKRPESKGPVSPKWCERKAFAVVSPSLSRHGVFSLHGDNSTCSISLSSNHFTFAYSKSCNVLHFSTVYLFQPMWSKN